MENFIEIEINNENSIPVSLTKILECCSNKSDKQWKLLWIDGLEAKKSFFKNFEYKSVINFEEKINKSKNGVLISMENLKKLDLSLNQILSLILINNDKKILRLENDIEMYNLYTTVIELIDGNHWEIRTKNILFKDNILKKIKDSKVVYSNPASTEV